MDNSAFSPSQICFGLSQDLDRTSFSCYLQLIGRKEFADTLAARLDSLEIERIVDEFTGLMHKHLSKTEYHQLFLLDDSHHHGEDGE
jgi:hypothetical protein